MPVCLSVADFLSPGSRIVGAASRPGEGPSKQDGASTDGRSFEASELPGPWMSRHLADSGAALPTCLHTCLSTATTLQHCDTAPSRNAKGAHRPRFAQRLLDRILRADFQTGQGTRCCGNPRGERRASRAAADRTTAATTFQGKGQAVCLAYPPASPRKTETRGEGWTRPHATLEVTIWARLGEQRARSL